MPPKITILALCLTPGFWSPKHNHNFATAQIEYTTTMETDSGTIKLVSYTCAFMLDPPGSCDARTTATARRFFGLGHLVDLLSSDYTAREVGPALAF